MSIREKIRDYKLRHLSLGKVKNLDKERIDLFQVEKISWDLHWQTNLYLAVIIRDYLRFFIKNTLAIGNCVIDDEEFRKGYNHDEEKNEYYAKKWKDLVNSVADEFDELVKLMTMSRVEIKDDKEWEKRLETIEKKAFSDLTFIFDDLMW